MYYDFMYNFIHNMKEYLLLSFLFILLRTLIKQFLIHLHEKLKSIIYKPVYCFVPMTLRVPVQAGEHQRNDLHRVLRHQRHHVLVVPVIQRPFGHLEMRRTNAFGELPEERHHHFLEFGRLDNVQYLLELVEEHHLFGTVSFRPIFQEALYDGLRQTGILLEELDHTVRKLRMVD